MARMLKEFEPQSGNYWIWVCLLWFMVVSLLGMAMVGGGGEGSSHGGGEGKGKKRKKTAERGHTPHQRREEKSIAQKKWEATLVERSVTCERDVDRNDIGTSPVIDRIIQ